MERPRPSSASFRFRPRVERLAPALAALDAFALLERLGERRAPVLLEGSGWPGGLELLAFDPLPGATWRSLVELRAALAGLQRVAGDALPGGFAGGFLGALAYELGPPEEHLVLPEDPWNAPPIVGGLYVDFVVRAPRGSGGGSGDPEAWLVLGEEPGDGRPSVGERRATLLAALDAPAPARSLRPLEPLQSHVGGAEHRARIEAAREQIARGEVYQANLARRFSRRVAGDPIALYGRLRALHPAPHLGFLRWERGAILSGSPELLLALEEDAQGPLARTRPIKGTIERGTSEEADRASAARLLASEKDLAELAMIVDLERNDLGRVARTGSVRVEGFPTLESYATVHHLAAEVRARPRPGVDALEVLASLFPGGSITGAPKLRSMELIGELEGEGRGFSYGALGMVDLRGQASFNLLIRTLLWRPLASPQPGPEPGPEPEGEVTYRVGGGITWASEAAAEEYECLIKGRALARSLDAEGEAGASGGTGASVGSREASAPGP